MTTLRSSSVFMFIAMLGACFSPSEETAPAKVGEACSGGTACEPLLACEAGRCIGTLEVRGLIGSLFANKLGLLRIAVVPSTAPLCGLDEAVAQTELAVTEFPVEYQLEGVPPGSFRVLAFMPEQVAEGFVPFGVSEVEIQVNTIGVDIGIDGEAKVECLVD